MEKMEKNEGLIAKLNQYEGVIFDLDGTLYKKKHISLFVSLFCWASIPKLLSVQLVRKTLRGQDLETNEIFMDNLSRKVKTRFGIPVKSTLKWYNKTFYPAIIRILSRYYKVDAWVLPFLEKYKGKTAVLSDYGAVSERLQAIGLDPDLFTILVSSESLGCLKPSPRAFLYAAKKIGLLPSQVVVVGDRKDTDGRGAELSGMDFIDITELE